MHRIFSFLLLADNLPINGPERFSLTRDFMTMRRIGLMQELTREKKRELRGQKFEREADKSTAEKDAAIAAIQRDSALAWLERYYAEAMAAVLAEQAAQVRTEIIAAEGAYRGGRGSQADAIATHSTLAALEERASEYASRIRVAKANLARDGSAHRPGRAHAGLDGGARVPAARPGVLQHGVARRFGAAALGPRQPPGPRDRIEARHGRAGARPARRDAARAYR